MKKILSLLVLFVYLILPSFSLAVDPSGLASGCNRGEPVRTDIKNADGQIVGTDVNFTNPCGFNDLMDLVNRVINFLLFKLATPIVAIGFCYAGFLYLTAAGSSENVGQAKGIMKNLVLGYVVALIAWILVKTIMITLGFDGTGIFLNIK